MKGGSFQNYRLWEQNEFLMKHSVKRTLTIKINNLNNSDLYYDNNR